MPRFIYDAVYIRPLQTQYTDLIVSTASHCQREKFFMRKYIFKSSRYASVEHVSSGSTMRMQSIRFGLGLCCGKSPSPRRHVGEIRLRKSDSERVAHVVGIVIFRQRISSQTRHVRALWQTVVEYFMKLDRRRMTGIRSVSFGDISHSFSIFLFSFLSMSVHINDMRIVLDSNNFQDMVHPKSTYSRQLKSIKIILEIVNWTSTLKSELPVDWKKSTIK